MANKCCDGNALFLSILAILFSPLAVLIHDGVHQPLFINILLFILGVLPGILHAWYIILGSRAFRRCVFSIVALILPPIAVGLKAGCTKHFWINILLTILGFLPGVVHALYIIWFRRNYLDLK